MGLGLRQYIRKKLKSTAHPTFWKWSDTRRQKEFTRFKKRVGKLIARAAAKYCVPAELLAAVVMNEYIDHEIFRQNLVERLKEGTFPTYDASVGIAQITGKFADEEEDAIDHALLAKTFSSSRAYRTWPNYKAEIASYLLSDIGSIDTAGALIKNFLDDLCSRVRKSTRKNKVTRLYEVTDPKLLSKSFMKIWGASFNEQDLKDICCRDEKNCEIVARRDVGWALIATMSGYHNAGRSFPEVLDYEAGRNWEARSMAYYAERLDRVFTYDDLRAEGEVDAELIVPKPKRTGPKRKVFYLPNTTISAR